MSVVSVVAAAALFMVATTARASGVPPAIVGTTTVVTLDEAGTNTTASTTKSVHTKASAFIGENVTTAASKHSSKKHGKGSKGTAPTTTSEFDAPLEENVDTDKKRNRNYNRDRKELERQMNGGSAYKSIAELNGGVCPANGNTHVLYVTTHVGTNIESYDTFGRYLGPLINTSSIPKSVEMQKLRGMVYGPDGLLYVAASRASFSRIFAISPNGLPLPLRKKSHYKGLITDTQSRSSASSTSSKGATTDSSSSADPHVNSFNSPNAALGDRINTNLNKKAGYDDDAEDNDDADLNDDIEIDEDGSNENMVGSRAEEVLLSPSSPELTFLNGEQRMLVTLPKQYRMNKDCTRNYIYSLAHLDLETNPNMNHPYSFFFHPEDGTMFVTNQNSITVTRYVGPTTTRKQVLDIMAATAGVIHRTPKLTASLKGLLRKVAPVAAGDPIPYSGGVSGYAGMPLPPSYSILQALRLAPNNLTRQNRGASLHPFFDKDETEDEEHKEGSVDADDDSAPNLLSIEKDHVEFAAAKGKRGSKGKGESDANHDIPSHIPSKAIGVFAAGWCPFYNLLSVRGMAISPKMLYSVTDRMFVHDMEVVPINNIAGAAVRGGATNSQRRGVINSLLNALSNLFFGSDSAASAANQQQGTTTIRRRVDLSTKTIVSLRVILVADVIGNSIHVLHEHTGELMWSYINVVRQPIQIHFPKSAERTSTSGDLWFYVTSKGGAVYKLHLRRQASANARTSVSTLIHQGNPMKAVSGFFENPAHNTLYIADRKGRSIFTYGTPGQQSDNKALYYTGTFANRLVGEPEHILYTSVVPQHSVPYCYELNHDGSIRYTSLCLAYQLWVVAAVVGAIVAILSWTQLGKTIVEGCCGWGTPRRRGAKEGSHHTDSNEEL